MKLTGRRWLFLISAVALAAMAGLALRAAWRRSIVLSGLPRLPTASVLPEAFGVRLEAAAQHGRAYFQSVQGLEELSALYHANGYYDEAMQCYGLLRRLEPRNGRWPHLEACILSQFGRMEEAASRERVAIALDPGYIAGHLRLGDELLKSNQVEAAAAAYEEVLRLAPGNPYALLGRAKCSVAENNWTTAGSVLDQAIKQNPDFVGALELMVTVAEHRGDQEEANALNRTIGPREFVDLPDPWLDALMESCFDPYRLSVAATVANLAGNRKEAIHLLERAIVLDPNQGAFHRELAVYFSNDSDPGSALEHLRKAVAVSPQDNDAWLLLYQLLNQMGEAGAANRALAEGLGHCPRSASLHLEQARAFKKAGLDSQAIEEFRVASGLNPSEAGTLVELANALFATNRGAEALDALHDALDRQPEQPMALATLTFYYISAGEESEALKWWAHVRQQPRTPQPMLDALRQAYERRFGREPM